MLLFTRPLTQATKARQETTNNKLISSPWPRQRVSPPTCMPHVLWRGRGGRGESMTAQAHLVTRPFCMYLEVPWKNTLTWTITLFQYTINHCVESNYFIIISSLPDTSYTSSGRYSLVLTVFKSLPFKGSCDGALSLFSNRCCTTWKIIENTAALIQKFWVACITDRNLFYISTCTWTSLTTFCHLAWS